MDAMAEQAGAADQDAGGAADGEEIWDAEKDGMKIYNCPSCGAQMICDATTAATSCPYCGNPSVVPGQFHGMLKPDYILPFKLSREEAIAALQVLGYHRRDIEKVFEKIDLIHLELEELIKEGLKLLSQK